MSRPQASGFGLNFGLPDIPLEVLRQYRADLAPWSVVRCVVPADLVEGKRRVYGVMVGCVFADLDANGLPSDVATAATVRMSLQGENDRRKLYWRQRGEWLWAFVYWP